MDAIASADPDVRSLVKVRTKVPGGPWFIELGQVVDEPVYLGPFANPATAREEARRVADCLGALVRTCQKA